MKAAAKILPDLRDIQEKYPDLQVLVDNLEYLEKREKHMQYPVFQSQGWPIGSGIVESGNKVVISARLNGAGMHWQRINVNPMLGLRNIICSDRWDQDWPIIARQIRLQTKQAQHNRRKKRSKSVLTPLSEPLSLPPKAHPAPAASPDLSQPAQNKQPWRPPANHPWRNYPPTSTAKL